MATPFVNWARNVRSEPSTWVRPGTVAEVSDTVARAHAEGRRIRVAGSRHSWSPLAASDDVQMVLTDLDRMVSLDAATGDVTVEAGCPLHVLLDVLASRGRALPIVGSVSAQTLAGVTATGTHGSSTRIGNISSGIVGAELVNGLGEVITIGRDDPHLAGLRVHLGALGVITKLTLQTVPAFKLEERRIRLPFEEACEHILDFADGHAYCKLWWLPHTTHAMIVTHEHTTEPGERSALAWTVDGLVNDWIFPAVLAFGGKVPAAIPPTNRLVDRLHFTEGVRRGRSDHMLQLVMPPRHQETELAFPLELAPQALRDVRQWIEDHRARLDFIVEMRFVAEDDGWMSPAYRRPTCQLGVYAAHSPDTERAFAAFRDMGRTWDARPHWGKQFTTNPTEIELLYPEAPAFRALARQLDPGGVFRNAFVDSVLGVV